MTGESHERTVGVTELIGLTFLNLSLWIYDYDVDYGLVLLFGFL